MAASPDHGFEVSAGPQRGMWCVTPRGELALHSRFRLYAAVERALVHAPTLVAIDLRGLEFVDGAGLSAAVIASRRCAAQGVHCVVVRGTGQIARLLEVTGLDEYVEFVHDLDAPGLTGRDAQAA